jgi:hypothetical protein
VLLDLFCVLALSAFAGPLLLVLLLLIHHLTLSRLHILKMMNIPGNLIRGAGSVVGGTMSAVASVAGRRGSSDMTSGEIVVKEKSVLTIKVIFSFSLHLTATVISRKLRPRML